MTPRALVIHHLPLSADDAVIPALESAGYELDHRFPIRGEPLPHPDDGHVLALVHGSLADVTKHDAPGIAEEMRWIEAWWHAGRPYFGICHGLQLAAQLLGAPVGPPDHGQGEFGYYRLKSHEPELVPDGLYVFQWHHYGAGLPDGAKRLAESDLYPNQIIGFDRLRFGLQCHAEMSLADQARLRAADPSGMAWPGAQRAAQQTAFAADHYRTMRRWMETFLRRWLDEIPGDSGTLIRT